MTAQATPPRRTPRKPSHWVRNASYGVIAVFVLLAVVGAASRPPSSTGPTTPTDVVSADESAPDDGTSESSSPTPAGESLLSIKGTGAQTSDEFHASGNSVGVTYDYTCPEESSFTLNFYGTNGSPLLSDVLVSDFGTTGTDTLTENLNGATGPFTVEVDASCDWTVEVTGTP